MSRFWPADLSTPKLLSAYKALHAKDDDEERRCTKVDVEGERALVLELTKRGFPPRYVDNLAKAAGTIPGPEVAPPTLDEILAYVDSSSVGIDPAAVTIAKSVSGGGRFILNVSTPALREASHAILKAVQREVPPGIQVDMAGGEQMGDFLEARALYALQLVPSRSRKAIITTAKSYMASLRQAAARASKIFKEDKDPVVPFRIVKRAMVEGIVTGAVAVPDIPDATVTKESDADIYDEETVRGAMYFWMEHARGAFSYHHLDHGGRPLAPDDVVLLENWQARSDFIEGDQHITKGTWMMSTRVKHPGLLADIEALKINSWSLGLNCLAGFEEAA